MTSTPRIRNGNASQCATRGALLRPRRGGRRQRFCSDRCRQSARREGGRWGGSGATRSVKNPPAKSGTSKADLADRTSLPIEILGHGWRSPRRRRDPTSRRQIVRCEVGGELLLAAPHEAAAPGPAPAVVLEVAHA
jgi:hypothetical protein